MAGTLAAVFNMALVTITGIVLIGNEWVAETPSRAWVALGLGLLVWGGVIASALLRPVVLALEDDGLAVRGVFGTKRIRWEDLRWAELDRNPRFGLVAAEGPDGAMRYVGVSKRHWPDGTVDAVLGAIRTRRPDLPLHNPETVKESA